LEVERLDPHLATRLQGFFRVPGNSFHAPRLARAIWHRNDIPTTIA
jgi:hypothetical protein